MSPIKRWRALDTCIKKYHATLGERVKYIIPALRRIHERLTHSLTSTNAGITTTTTPSVHTVTVGLAPDLKFLHDTMILAWPIWSCCLLHGQIIIRNTPVPNGQRNIQSRREPPPQHQQRKSTHGRHTKLLHQPLQLRTHSPFHHAPSWPPPPPFVIFARLWMGLAATEMAVGAMR